MLLVEYQFGFHITWITARNVIGIRVQCQTNVSKQAMLLDGVDVGLLQLHICGCGLNGFVYKGMNQFRIYL